MCKVKSNILVLNSNYFPLHSETWERVFVKIFSGGYYPLDITYECANDGNVDFSSIQSLLVIKTVDLWLKLPIRSYDEYAQTTNGPVRIPQIVICSDYSKIYYKQVVFPTKTNIYKRDNYTCGYTLKKLSRSELSIDHIRPVSRGGKNTFENMITCDRKLNSWKGDRLPKECGLKLKLKPTKPVNGFNGLIIDDIRPEWESFVK